MCDFYKIGNKTICRLGEFLFVISILVLVGVTTVNGNYCTAGIKK